MRDCLSSWPGSDGTDSACVLESGEGSGGEERGGEGEEGREERGVERGEGREGRGVEGREGRGERGGEWREGRGVEGGEGSGGRGVEGPGEKEYYQQPLLKVTYVS